MNNKAPTVTLAPVVGIGASAGGFDALQAFVPRIEPDSGLAYVVVQHLDPEQTSHLTALLGRHAPVPVEVAKEGTAVAPNRVYVIEPNTTLTIGKGRLHAVPPKAPRGQRNPIDAFFTSLALELGTKAACVILSGSGSDGTIGLRAIKEQGGLVLAQAHAEYDGMMRSAVATGLVDFVLPASEMPSRLAAYFHRLGQTDGPEAQERAEKDTVSHLSQICALLRNRTGHDFSGYKDKTLIRRIQRRMQVLQVDGVPAYLTTLRKDGRELDLLFQDILIGVTSFFRDVAAFDSLSSKVIPHVFEGKGADDMVRVWVPGCATGEEAYSVAILLREHAPKSGGVPKLQVFATDIDEHALEVARIGRYPASIEADLPPKYLNTYFRREDGSYRVTNELREICLFSAHNLLRDAPFSRLDLVSCRNLLIYLETGLQNRVIPLFHYALRDRGYLFLGSSENVARHARLFAPVDKSYRIFQRRPLSERQLPEFPLTLRAPDNKPVQHAKAAPGGDTVPAVADRMITERFLPAHVVVDPEGEILHLSGRTGKYFEFSAGAPSSNMFSMARAGLRVDLRAAFHKATSTGQPVLQQHIRVGTNGGEQVIDLSVLPLPRDSNQRDLYLIVFQDVGAIQKESAGTRHAGADTVRELEADLLATKERLQLTTEELESSNEELKSGNEELSSMNEELQSANEELETSKEELQSINEELQTVNAELHARVEELSRANSDIANLLESTQIATVFLDRNMTVKSFTPAAMDLFRLVESDTGRPITHVRARFRNDTVQEDAENVMRTLKTIERQITSSETEARYVMRMMPYRTVDNVIGGVVITFVDVTRISVAEARVNELTRALRHRVESLEALLDLVPVGIYMSEDTEAREVLANRAALRLVGEDEVRKGPRRMTAIMRLFRDGKEIPPAEQPLQRAIRTGAAVPQVEARLERRNGEATDVIIEAVPLFEDGKVRGAIAAIVDISDRKMLEQRQELLLHEVQHRVKNILSVVGSVASRMLDGAQSVDEFRHSFLPRLGAMGRVHDLLSKRSWEGADLRTLVQSVLEPHVTPRKESVSIKGPEIIISPNEAASLGMVLHELAANATKHGALATPRGRLAVTWKKESVDGGAEHIALDWVERAGAPLKPPNNNGFGIEFIQRNVEYELEGEAELEFKDDGLRCTIRFPLGNGLIGEAK